jgi:hypothetical protein
MEGAKLCYRLFATVGDKSSDCLLITATHADGTEANAWRSAAPLNHEIVEN